MEDFIRPEYMETIEANTFSEEEISQLEEDERDLVNFYADRKGKERAPESNSEEPLQPGT